MSLVYSGREGQIFSGIHLGYSSKPARLNCSLDEASVHVVIPISSLNGQGSGPPQKVWPDALKFIWSNVLHEKTRLLVPVASLAAGFAVDPDPLTQAALGLIFSTILARCQKSGDRTDWLRLTREGRSASTSCILISKLRRATSRRIEDSNKRKQKASFRSGIKNQRKRRVRLAYTFPSYLLASLIIANWDEFKPIRRKELFLTKLAALASAVSPTLGDLFDEINPDDPGNPIYQYLTKHGFHHFKRGALSAEEREESGLDVRSKGKTHQKKNKIQTKLRPESYPI
jgi:hypothetical protein